MKEIFEHRRRGHERYQVRRADDSKAILSQSRMKQMLRKTIMFAKVDPAKIS